MADGPPPRPTSWSIDPSWPSTVVGRLWLYDTNQPSFVNVAAKTVQESAWVLEVNCPPGECSSGEYSPETLTLDKYDRIEGARTADGTTTYWDCFRAHSEYLTATSFSERVTVSFSRVCAATTGVDISRPDQAKATPMMEYDYPCEYGKRQVAAVTTAGMELVYEYRPWLEPEVTRDLEMVQADVDALSRAMCTTTHIPNYSDYPEPDPGQVYGPETSRTETSTTETSGATEKADEDEDKEAEEGGTRRILPSAVLVGMLVIFSAVFS